MVVDKSPAYSELKTCQMRQQNLISPTPRDQRIITNFKTLCRKLVLTTVLMNS
jgi:hypothetical protein